MSEPSFRLQIEPLDEGGFVATSPDIPGLAVEGETVEEVWEIAPHVARGLAECCLEHGNPLPPGLARFLAQ